MGYRCADGPPERLKESGKQAKTPMFSIISRPRGAAGSRTSGSHAMVVQKVSRHFRRCGILPRQGGWEARGKRKTNRRKGDKDVGGKLSGQSAMGAFFLFPEQGIQ